MREQGLSYYDIKLCANTEWLLVIPKEGDEFTVMYYNQETGEIIECFNNSNQTPLRNSYLTKYNLDFEKYSHMIYFDRTDMAGYWRY